MNARNAKQGDKFKHRETGTIATFQGWCQGVHGPLMVLHHPKFGVCRWDPARVMPFKPVKEEETCNE